MDAGSSSERADQAQSATTFSVSWPCWTVLSMA